MLESISESKRSAQCLCLIMNLKKKDGTNKALVISS
ncbi:hypothetical protein AAZX31_20G210600 [Glycine max]